MKENKDNTLVKYMKIGAIIAAVFVVFTEFKRCNAEKKGSEQEIVSLGEYTENHKDVFEIFIP